MVKEALPSDPVEIMGWRDMPEVGDDIIEVDSEACVMQAWTRMTHGVEQKRAKEVVEYRKLMQEQQQLSQMTQQTPVQVYPCNKHRSFTRDSRRSRSRPSSHGG